MSITAQVMTQWACTEHQSDDDHDGHDGDAALAHRPTDLQRPFCQDHVNPTGLDMPAPAGAGLDRGGRPSPERTDQAPRAGQLESHIVLGEPGAPDWQGLPD